MNANEKQTLHLPAGQVLSIAAASGASGSAIRLAKMPGGGDAQSVTAITTGATFTFGPYAETERFEVICTTGVLTITTEAKELDNDGTLAANSDSLVPTQKAVKTYVDALLPLLDALTYQGVISALATFPAASRGHLYKITAAGAIGGTGPTVAVGDMAICNTDATVTGTYAEVGTKWDIIPATNIDTLSDLIAATAENDVIVAGPNPFAWVKKTIGQFKTILGLGTAAYTAATAYDAAGTASGLVAAKIDKIPVEPVPTGYLPEINATGELIKSAKLASDVHAAGSDNQDLSALAPINDATFTGKTKFEAVALPTKTPINAVASSRVLTFIGQPVDGETATMGDKTYEFQTVIGSGTAASGALTFTGNAEDNETVTIGTGSNERVYTFQEAINAAGVKASGVLTFTGPAVENETITLGNAPNAKTYRWRDQIAGIAASKTLVFSDVGANGETVTIDTTAYEFVTALTEAKATGTLTATANPQDGARVTIGNITYTFRDTLALAYDVKIGANAEESLLNLVEAITYDGGAGTNEGTDYGTGTVAHTLVTAAEGAGDTVDVTALAIGTAGNAITSVDFSPGLEWAAVTLLGGLDAVAHEVLVEATAEACIDNLVACATAAAGAGTKYSTGETAHATVTVAKTNATTITATAKSTGAAGNAIPIAVTCANAAWDGGAVFLTGGYDAAVANDVIIGSDAEVSIDNLVLAIAAVTGSGVNYGTGTTAHTTITGAKNAADKFTATATSIGDVGDSYVSTTTMTLATWGDTTLNGGEGVDVAYDVLIGATAEASIDNLVAAINKAAGESTTYGTGTVAHPSVTAAKTAADTLTATAASVGDDGNLIAVATDVSLASWAGAGFLTGGDDAEKANDVLIGISAEDSIDNLIKAITDAGTEGTHYGTGTTANAYVTAVKTDTDKVTATAKTAGVAGNSIAIATDIANASWADAATFLGGGVNSTTGEDREMCADASYYYISFGASTVSTQNWRRFAKGNTY